jgi:2'-5' RNA ligase
MRLFIGIPLSPAVVAELASLTARLKSKAGSLRWTGPESWHITLQFLGNTSEEKLDCLVAGLGELRFPPVPVRLEELGIFERAGVFFASVAVTPELVSLEQRVTAATSLCGFVREDRPFRPHITLARAKGQGRIRSLRPLEALIQRQPVFTRFLAQEFLLYESHLLPNGSRYEVRARFPLDSSAPPTAVRGSGDPRDSRPGGRRYPFADKP